jgi:RimJ/RimL family protein N-acetyltransferase
MMNIRPAQMSDAEALFRWRNDALTREMSHNQDPVEWDAHIAWLKARLARPEPNLYIAECDGLSIGTVRVDGDEISYTIAPDARGRGLGLAMLQKAKEMFGQLRAEIYERNIASIKIAERAGMRLHILTTDTQPTAAYRPRHRTL